MYNHVSKFALLSAAVFAAGCASFQARNLPVVQDDDYKVTKQEKVKVFSRWKVETTSSVVNQTAAAAIYKSSFEKATRDSGCCEIVEGPTEAALVVDGTVVDHSDAAALVPAVITGLSLYTIPSWVKQTIDIKVSAKRGENTKTYELNDSFTLVQWLPMMFAFPFTGGPVANGEELNANTFKNLIVKLKQDEFL